MAIREIRIGQCGHGAIGSYKRFNHNLPYDQFTIWQLAGDLLPDTSPEQKLATGFARNHMINGEGGRIPEENRVEYVMDVTETVGTVWGPDATRCHTKDFPPSLPIAPASDPKTLGATITTSEVRTLYSTSRSG
jgi:hypothetical protein